MAEVGSPWFRHYMSLDPRPVLMKVRCPVLALNGERDLQVPSKANVEAIAKALQEGGNKDFTVKELPNGIDVLLSRNKGFVPGVGHPTSFLRRRVNQGARLPRNVLFSAGKLT